MRGRSKADRSTAKYVTAAIRGDMDFIAIVARGFIGLPTETTTSASGRTESSLARSVPPPALLSPYALSCALLTSVVTKYSFVVHAPPPSSTRAPYLTRNPITPPIILHRSHHQTEISPNVMFLMNRSHIDFKQTVAAIDFLPQILTSASKDHRAALSMYFSSRDEY